MYLRNPVDLLEKWLDSSLFLTIGIAGVVLISLGFKREDIVRPIFIVAGLVLMAIGFGGQFLGWRL